jgi:mutator protein MutT
VKFLRIDVVAGIIINQNKILIGKRKDKDIGGGKWEFPGGKIEVGETNSEALERELYEELGISAKIGKELMNYEHMFKTTIYNITFMEITDYEGEIRNNAHSEIKWVKFSKLPEYDFISGDDRFIQSLLKSKSE